MAQDSSLYLRQAGMTLLKNSPDVVAIVGACIYGPNPVANATWPFVRWGFPIVKPYLAACMDGSSVDFAVHGFAKGDDEGVSSLLGAAIVGALGNAWLVLPAPYPAEATVRWVGSQIIRDSVQSSAWHSINQFEATITS